MKMRFKQWLVAIIAFSLVAACNEPAEAPDMAALKTEIQAKEDAFAAALKAKDADGVVAYYADDAISYGRNSKPAVGKAAIKEGIANGMASDTIGRYDVFKVVDLFGQGNMIVEVGSWETLNPDTSPYDSGFYLSYFEKRDGKYVCVRDMNMTTTPANKPAE